MKYKVCPQCGHDVSQTEELRCPRCNQLLLVPCDGNCSRCKRDDKCRPQDQGQ